MRDKIPNSINYIELPARNAAALATSKRFFTEAFGWTWKDWGDEYADTHSSGVNSGLNGTHQHRTAHPLVVLYVTNLEEARAKVIAAGGVITDDIFEFPGGRRFHFRDPSGNELGAWSE
ncbi:MAG TPA: VOC family protein [Caulifigura sp.]|nr:VOC family protein [Caulifigura sp.]